MGRRGPAPRPEALKKLNGTYRKDRAPKNPVTPATERPRCPTWLPREAKAEWRRIVPELEKLGLLARIDRSALAAYCQCVSDWRDAQEVIDKVGTTIEITKEAADGTIFTSYVQQRPEVAMKHKSLTLLKGYLAEFGLTPSARAKLNIQPKEKEKNPWESLIN